MNETQALAVLVAHVSDTAFEDEPTGPSAALDWASEVRKHTPSDAEDEVSQAVRLVTGPDAQAAWTEAVRQELEALVADPDLAGSRKQVAGWVEAQTEGFSDWLSDGLSAREAAEAALSEATGVDDPAGAGEAATDRALGLSTDQRSAARRNDPVD